MTNNGWHTRWIAAWVAGGLLIAVSAHAGMIDKQGMAPYEICGLCHSLNGISRMAKFPKLAGQKAAYLQKQFLDFHTDRRTNDGGQMRGITTEVNLDDLDEIARYFSQLPAPPAVSAPRDDQSQALYQRGAQLFHHGRDGIAACATCHGVEAEPMPLSPWLDAQHRDYLVKQLYDFQQGNRTNDPDAVMRSIASQLTGDDIHALAHYLESTQMRQPKP